MPAFVRKIATPWMLLICLPSVVIAGPESLIDTVKPLASEWTRLRSETFRLQDQWDRERLLIEGGETVAKLRIQALRSRLNDIEASRGSEQRLLDESAAQNKLAAESVAVAEHRLRELSGALVALRPSLPPRLSASLNLAFKSLEKEGLPPGERMQHCMTILNRCGEFDRQVSFSEESLSLPGQSGQRLVQVLYWGLAGAYAIDPVAKNAYRGHPSAKDWVWTESRESFAPVERLVSVYREKSDPEFIPLNATLRTAGKQIP